MFHPDDVVMVSTPSWEIDGRIVGINEDPELLYVPFSGTYLPNEVVEEIEDVPFKKAKPLPSLDGEIRNLFRKMIRDIDTPPGIMNMTGLSEKDAIRALEIRTILENEYDEYEW